MTSAPIVSILVLVYNHEPYLRQCLNGIVTQNTDFPFEAIIHEDASTDDSAAIVREYAEKHPHIIKPIYQKENQFQKVGNGNLWRDVRARRDTRAPYYAICEGDDYWSDCQKLQQQVEALEAHPACSLCTHHYEVLSDGKLSFRKASDARELNMIDLLYNRIHVQTATMLYRNMDMPLVPPDFPFRFPVYQLFWVYRLAAKGNIYCIDKPLSVYRVHQGGIFSSQARNRQIRMAFGNRCNIIDWFKQDPDRQEIVDVLRRQTKQMLRKAFFRDLRHCRFSYIMEYRKMAQLLN